MRRMRWELSAIVGLALVVPSVVHAAEAKRQPDPEKVFARKDADGDGKLSLEEFKTGMKDKGLANADRRFRKLDANADGKLSLEEFKAGMKATAATE
jgi:Ca2+-binding EF-hand superfamily protein